MRKPAWRRAPERTDPVAKPASARLFCRSKPAMKKLIDGRTVKGERIREQFREQILAAYIDLISAGVTAPTALEIAERGHLSPRVIFKHFADLHALRLAAFARIQQRSDEFFARDIPHSGSAEERLKLFLDKHTRRLEFLMPIRRTAAMLESVDADAARALRQARTGALLELQAYLGPSLKAFPPAERRELLTRLHMVCSWESLDFLRKHYRLSPSRARALISGVALALLADSERRARAR
jgi:AcrR family transcriptional regulator